MNAAEVVAHLKRIDPSRSYAARDMASSILKPPSRERDEDISCVIVIAPGFDERASTVTGPTLETAFHEAWSRLAKTQ